MFNHATIGLSVPLVYPFLIYLLVRLLALAFGKGVPREPLALAVPAPWLAIAIVFLVGFRVGLNVTNSNVIDVGYAGVIGAHKLLHGQPLYGNWPYDNASGDTYGPVNYYAYVPAYLIFGWSGSWDQLPTAHAAAIAFDLLTLLGLVLARSPDPWADARNRVRLPLGRVPVHAVGAVVEHERHARRAAAGGRAAGHHVGAGARRGGRARRADQVRAARAGAAADAGRRTVVAAPAVAWWHSRSDTG